MNIHDGVGVALAIGRQWQSTGDSVKSEIQRHEADCISKIMQSTFEWTEKWYGT